MENKPSELSKPNGFVVTGGKMHQDRALKTIRNQSEMIAISIMTGAEQ